MFFTQVIMVFISYFPGNSVPIAPDLALSGIYKVPESTYEAKLKALGWKHVTSKKPSKGPRLEMKELLGGTKESEILTLRVSKE